MKKLLRYIPFHFLLYLIVGICLQFLTNFWQYDFYILLLLFGILLIGLLLCRLFNKKTTFTVLSWLLFIFIGIATVYIQDKRNYKQHYTTTLTKNSVAIVIIQKVLKSSKRYNKYIAEVHQINNRKTIGTILVNIQKDSLQQLSVNQKIIVAPSFKNISSAKNPHTFDYKSHLAKQGIQQQLFVKSNEFKKIGTPNCSLIGFSIGIREKIQETLQKYNFSEEELSVMTALLLGQRKNISKELRENYINAGAIHILAISGLHIGILLSILLWVLKPLERLKYGKISTTIIIILLLWLFALIAGLSASVVRAVTMFSFVAIGELLTRKTCVEHSLVSSMLLLLLIQPLLLFDVGFQLSYLAVFSIIWMQPLLYSFWKPRIKIVNKLWQLITVSIAAQLGILPISLYYFHQFSSLFLLSNLILIPITGSILIGGIIVISLSLLNMFPSFLANIYGYILSLMNRFVSWVASFEQFVFKDISMSFITMITWYSVLFFLVGFLIKQRPRRLILLLISIVILQFVYLFEKTHRNTTQEFIVFHQRKKSIIGKRTGNKINVFHNLDTIAIQQHTMITSYTTNESVRSIFQNNIPNIFNFDNKKILVVDSIGIYQLNQLKKPIVVLRQSPKINLERLIATLHPIQIIADGSNYRNYVDHWKETCKKEKTPFHHTRQKGAYILK